MKIFGREDTWRPKSNLPVIALIGIIGLFVVIILQLFRPLLLGGTSSLLGPMPTQSHISSLNHLIGGFSIKSNAEIANASNDGIQATLIYGYTPSETNDSVGETLKANNMKVIDAIPWQDLYYYECHIHKSCSATTLPELISPQAVLSDVSAHLKQVQTNSLVIGYWVLDDWAYEPGIGKDLLIQINNLMHQYTPGKPSICGFGGEIPPLPLATFEWNDGTAANFSPQGCDMVALYIYGEPYTTGNYDWTMSNILPAVFTSLKKRGWNITKEPLVGIPQVFGGTVSGEPWPLPDVNSVETQTITYCKLGAPAIIYYNWGKSGQSPMTDPQITLGIKNGIADCKGIWK